MLGIIAVLNAAACFSLIQKVMESENQGNTLSLISLSFAAVWDMYLCILNFLFAVQVEVFTVFLRFLLNFNRFLIDFVNFY